MDFIGTFEGIGGFTRGFEAAGVMEGLDDWLSKGGFLPNAWAR